MYAVIMAGGAGTRFWPRSRFKHPKQLLRIFGERTMIQSTIERLDTLIDRDNTYIVSTVSLKEAIQNQLPSLKPENLIIEPKGKNTAPCIGLAAVMIRKIDPEGVMAVLPADHNIKEEQKFRQILATAEKVALQHNTLVTIGISPTYPATGYGYIQYNGQIADIGGIPVFKVKTFAEKPDLKTAERFMDSGDFLWNSGMFVWKVKTILKEIEEALPELYDGLLEIEQALGTKSQDEVINKVYCQIKSISIDYGVMERTQNVSVLMGNFGWSDVGSWEEVYQISEKDGNENVVFGEEYINKDSSRCLIDVPDKVIVTIGIENMIIVDTPDALIVCRRDRAQDVKEIVDILKKRNLTNYL